MGMANFPDKFNVASRGVGETDKDGKITKFKLVSYDIVSQPAFKDAVIKVKQKWYIRLMNTINNSLVVGWELLCFILPLTFICAMTLLTSIQVGFIGYYFLDNIVPSVFMGMVLMWFYYGYIIREVWITGLERFKRNINNSQWLM